MRVIERTGRDLNDPVHAAAFQVRLRIASNFVAGINVHLGGAVDLLAVRDGVKCDFVLRDLSGATLAVMRPIVVRGSGNVEGMHVQTTGSGGSSGEFGFSAGELASAAEIIGRHPSLHSAAPGVR
jgi:hypothetical protein